MKRTLSQRVRARSLHSIRRRGLRLEPLEPRCLLAGDALASIELVVVDSQGAPLTHVDVGEEFVLRALVRDLRPDATGVFAAYTDVTFDASLASMSGPVTRATLFSGGLAEHTFAEGELSEVGGFRPHGSTEAVGVAGTVFFSVPLVADAAGELVVAANPADALPMHDVLLLGLNDYVPQDRIQYGFVRLQIGDPSESPASPWRNPGNPADVNADGVVDMQDVAQLQAELELRDGESGLDHAQAGKAPYYDVTGDRLVTSADLAAVQLQLPGTRPPTSGGPSGDPGPGDPADDEANDRLLDRIKSWIEFDWQIELRVTSGLTNDPISSARVGDVVHVHAFLHVPDDASSAEIDRFLPLLSKNVLSAFTETGVSYDATKLKLVEALARNDAYAYERSLVDPTLDAAARLEAYKKIVEGEHWLTGASFVVMQSGTAPFLTLPKGTEPGAGLGLVPSGVEVNEAFAKRLANSPVLQDFGAKFSRRIQHAAATIDLTAAATRPSAQNDTYDLTSYHGELIIEAQNGVLANDGAGDGAQALLVRKPVYGTVTLNPDGSLRYVHDFERLHQLSDTFAYVVVNSDGTSEFAEVDIRADNLPPLAEVSIRAINGAGEQLDSVYVGEKFFLQAVVTDLRPEGAPGGQARGANDALIDLSFSTDTLKVDGPVDIHSKFAGKQKFSGPAHVQPWSAVGPGDIRVRGISGTGPEAGTLEVFRVLVEATAAGAAEVNVDSARVNLRSTLVNIPARLVRLAGLSLDVQVDPSTLRLWSNASNSLDVNSDGQVSPSDVLEIINHLNAFGSHGLEGEAAAAGTDARRTFLDADRDNHVSPSDALAVINFLNSRRRGSNDEPSLPSNAPEGEAASGAEADLLTLLAADQIAENRRRR